MSRSFSLLRLALAAPPAALAALASPALAVGAERPVPRVAVSVPECTSSPRAEARAATFVVRSTARRSGRHAIRADLQVRDDGRWRTLPAAAGFGDWDRSSGGARRFVVRHRVSALVPGRAYRVRAKAVWRDADGAPHRTTRTSRSCVQRELRPDVSVLALGAAGEGRFLADVRVDDAARLADAPRWVLELDGTAVQQGTLATADGLQRLELGPVSCPAGGGELRLRLDPEDTVDERDERDDEATIPCPAPAGAAGTLGSP